MKLVWIPSELFLMAPVDCMRADTNSMRHGTLSSISSCQFTPKFHFSIMLVVVSSFISKKKVARSLLARLVCRNALDSI